MKLEKCAKIGILGYCETSRLIEFWMSTNVIFISRDVRFEDADNIFRNSINEKTQERPI